MQNTVKLNGKRLFAVIDSDSVVIDCWTAETLEEAQEDNPGKTVLEVTLENSPFTIGTKYTIKD
jgi:hypothetical protein